MSRAASTIERSPDPERAEASDRRNIFSIARIGRWPRDSKTPRGRAGFRRRRWLPYRQLSHRQRRRRAWERRKLKLEFATTKVKARFRQDAIPAGSEPTAAPGLAVCRIGSKLPRSQLIKRKPAVRGARETIRSTRYLPCLDSLHRRFGIFSGQVGNRIEASARKWAAASQALQCEPCAATRAPTFDCLLSILRTRWMEFAGSAEKG